MFTWARTITMQLHVAAMMAEKLDGYEERRCFSTVADAAARLCTGGDSGVTHLAWLLSPVRVWKASLSWSVRGKQ